MKDLRDDGKVGIVTACDCLLRKSAASEGWLDIFVFGSGEDIGGCRTGGSDAELGLTTLQLRMLRVML